MQLRIHVSIASIYSKISMFTAIRIPCLVEINSGECEESQSITNMFYSVTKENVSQMYVGRGYKYHIHVLTGIYPPFMRIPPLIYFALVLSLEYISLFSTIFSKIWIIQPLIVTWQQYIVVFDIPYSTEASKCALTLFMLKSELLPLLWVAYKSMFLFVHCLTVGTHTFVCI